MKNIKVILKPIFDSKIIYILICLTAIIAYGQIVFMTFWQDDNAVVFKFTHINEQAGYLGKGIFGEGAYRYTITPYLPIFHFFGYNPVPYFSLALVFFIVSVYAVYFFYLTIFNHKVKAGIAGLLYAAGYVASDGFIRMFNSILTSLSVVFVCGVLGFYYRYFKTKHLKWYFLSILSYLLAVEIGFIRTHYFILVILSFEFIFFFFFKKTQKNFFPSLFASIFRLIPFLFIFYRWYVVNADSRSDTVLTLINSVLKGEFYKTYSFFGTLGNMLLANESFARFIQFVQTEVHIRISENRAIMLLIFFSIVFSLYLIKQKFVSVKLSVLFIVVVSLILGWAKEIFSYQGLIGGLNEKISLYTGIFFVLFSLLIIKILPNKKINSLLFIWMIANLAAYSGYIPIYSYPSDNRYLLHSFIPLVGLFALWGYDFLRFGKNKVFLPLMLVIFWGGINLFSSVTWQQKILEHRSFPTKRFFSQLHNYVPSFPKGSIFYFYIPDKPFAQAHYNAAFSVAQMPDETAMAWRYGLDRYDFKIVNSFEDLKQNMIKNDVPVDHIFAFIADPNELINVTNETRTLIEKGNIIYDNPKLEVTTDLLRDKNKTIGNIKPLLFTPKKEISSLIPIKLTLTLHAVPLIADNIQFPFYMMGVPKALPDNVSRSHYLDFRKWEESFYKTAKIYATTTWKNFDAKFLLDNDTSTYWEADRIAWDDHNQGITLDLGKVMKIGSVFYQNGPESLTPTKFEIQTSMDNEVFATAKEINYVDLTKRNDIQKITFTPTSARYVRILFHQTLYQDAPGISEIEVVPSEFSDINPMTAQNFFRNPFAEVKSSEDWNNLINSFLDYGLVRVAWKTDINNKLITTAHATVSIKYNNQEQKITVEIPAGGQRLEYIEITPVTMPGILILDKVQYQNFFSF